MRIELRYFAGLREAVGLDRESLELPPGVADAAALREHLRARGGPWADAMAASRMLRVAVDQAMATPATPLRDGAEVAFFPPVTGG
jgi:molybdopterin synthase sulfur carrier subunit